MQAPMLAQRPCGSASMWHADGSHPISAPVPTANASSRCTCAPALQAAAFSLSQATTCYVWGTWSSHYGRKVGELGPTLPDRARCAIGQWAGPAAASLRVSRSRRCNEAAALADHATPGPLPRSRSWSSAVPRPPRLCCGLGHHPRTPARVLRVWRAACSTASSAPGEELLCQCKLRRGWVVASRMLCD